MSTISDKQIGKLWRRADRGKITFDEFNCIMQEHEVTSGRILLVSYLYPARWGLRDLFPTRRELRGLGPMDRADAIRRLILTSSQLVVIALWICIDCYMAWKILAK